MRDVAARAGVSRSLVSTVFRGVPGASPANRERILQAAADLGYRPDGRARQLRSSQRRVIGVTLTATQPFHVAMVEALHDATELRGYELSIALSTDTRTIARAADTLLAQRCAALVLIGPSAPDEEIVDLAEASGGIPVIAADRFLDAPGVDAVRIDDEAAMLQLVGHLAHLGHKDIWYADGAGYVSAEPRRRGFVSAMAVHGLSERGRVIPAGATLREGAAVALTMLDHGELPTAVVAYNDWVACGLIDVFTRGGVRVPEDVSIVGFDNIPESALPHLDFTTIEQRSDDLTSRVVEILVQRLAGAPSTGLQLMPPGPLVVRSSTSSPRPGGRLRSVAG